jgi:hypothetical protein
MSKKKKNTSLLRRFLSFLWYNWFTLLLKPFFIVRIVYIRNQIKQWLRPTIFLYQVRKNLYEKQQYIFYLEVRAYIFYWYRYFKNVFFFSRKSRRSFFFSFELWVSTLLIIFDFIDSITIIYYRLYLIYGWWYFSAKKRAYKSKKK